VSPIFLKGGSFPYSEYTPPLLWSTYFFKRGGGSKKKKKKKTLRKKKFFFFFIWGPYSLKGFPYSEYVLFQRGPRMWGQKNFFLYGGLFFKGAPLFRVRPFPLRYVLSSTDFLKGGEVKKFLWSYSLQETLFVSKKKIYFFL
jgi:hypothetical protein